MKISPAPPLHHAYSLNTQPLTQPGKQLAEGETEDEPKYVLSKFLDTKAQKYSEDNAMFGDQYKNLEKVYKHFFRAGYCIARAN